jgi:phenylacetate-CoA ligase
MNKRPWQSDFDIQYSAREQSDRVLESNVAEHVNMCLAKSPFYRKLGIREISGIKDLPKAGFTFKDDLLKFNDEFLAVPEADIIDTCFTSATEGTIPVNFLLTAGDLERLTYNEQEAFRIAGVTKEDKMAVCVALERGFMAGLAYFLGGVKLGTHMIRVGASGPRHIWNILKIHKPTVMIGVPSVLAGVAGFALDEGEDPRSLKIGKILCIGEPLRDKDLKLLPSTRRIEELWNAPIFSTYASTEMASSFCECAERQGGHFRPELIYIEIIGDDGLPVSEGGLGEVVVTPIGVEGMPLVRFRTGDISYIINENCRCGRKTRRIAPVLGRKSQMLKYRGTVVFPNSIVSIVEANADFNGCYVEVYRAQFGEDRVVAVISAKGSKFDLEKLKEEFRAGLRVVPEIRIVDNGELVKITQPSGSRKRKIFFDMRRVENL